MNKEYKALFLNMSITAETIAEKAMAVHKEEKKVMSYGKAKEMRETFMNLTNKIKNDEPLTKKDCAMISLACSLVIENMRSQIQMYEMSIKGCNELIEKLKQVVASNDDNLANELFNK